MRSRSPSIFTPGQFAKKYLASAQEVIWEQCLRASHRNDGAAFGTGDLSEAIGGSELDGPSALLVSLLSVLGFTSRFAFNSLAVGCLSFVALGQGPL